MFELLLVGIIVFLIVRLSNAGRSKETEQQVRDRVRDEANNRRWLDYIRSYSKAAKNEYERRMIDAMVEGGTVDAFLASKPSKAADKAAHSRIKAGDTASASAAAEEGQFAAALPPAPDDAPPARAVIPGGAAVVSAKPMDGTLLLLYFGAFLFVASAGLFVAFGDFSGSVRTLLVLLTMGVMYGGGLLLHGRSERLKPAGLAFVAIGLAIVPLVGLAAYNYLGAGVDGRVIWLLTSVLGLAMYGHAVYRLRTTLLAYLFIFSFVSLFESGIAVLHAAVPYYVWGFVVAGLLLRFMSLRQRVPLLDGQANRSSQLLVPLGTLGALALVPEHGIGQLSFGLFLAALYYTLEAYAAHWRRPGYITAAQVLYIAAIAGGVYAATGRASLTAAALLVLTAAQALILYVQSPDDRVARDMATVVFATPVAAVVVGWQDGVLLSIALLSMAATGAFVALLQRRPDAYIGGAAAVILLPVVFGQLVAEPQYDLPRQVAISFVAVALLLAVQSRIYRWTAEPEWRQPAAVLAVVAVMAALLPAWYQGAWTALSATLAAAAALAYLAWLERRDAIAAVAGVLLGMPVFLSLDVTSEPLFVAAVASALAGNLALVMLRHVESARWMVAGVGLLLPVALGGGGLDIHFTEVSYTYAYLVIMALLVVCRAAASQRSLAYVAGYLAAAAIAICASLVSDDSRIHTSVVMAVLLAMSIFLSYRVERRRHTLVFTPWLAQALLASVVWPGDSESTGTLALVLSGVLAVAAYAAAGRLQRYAADATPAIRGSSLATAYLPLWLGMFYDANDYVLPSALAVAGGLTLHYFWSRSQQAREWSGGIIVAAVLWLLSDAGVDNLQVYTHLIALTFAGYAYWRHTRNERDASLGYLRAMFAVATVPLVLQALDGEAGSLYGWLLILQQVGFMILGVVIGRRFLTWWGLYVSVAAVLYQLRHLGWAALTVLALFVIGIAVYRLSREARHHDA